MSGLHGLEALIAGTPRRQDLRLHHPHPLELRPFLRVDDEGPAVFLRAIAHLGDGAGAVREETRQRLELALGELEVEGALELLDREHGVDQ